MNSPTTIGEHKKGLEGKVIRFLGHPDWTETYYVHRYIAGPSPHAGLRLETTEDDQLEHTFSVQDSMKIEFVDDVEAGTES